MSIEYSQIQKTAQSISHASLLAGLTELYPPAASLAPVSHLPPTELEAALRAFVIDQRLNHKFHFHWVGSYLVAPASAGDVDVLVSRKAAAPISIAEVEAVLLMLRLFGLTQFNISLDPFFRNSGETGFQQRCQAGKPFYTWALLDPGTLKGIVHQSFKGDFRRYGKVVVVRRKLSQTHYHHKIQQRGMGMPPPQPVL